MVRIIVLLIVLSVWVKSGLSQNSESMNQEKVNGMSMVAINGAIDSSNVLPLKDLGTNWAASIPFAFMPSQNCRSI